MKISTCFRSLLGLALLIGLAVPATLDAADDKRPNIVFIFTDDHCTQALSAYDDSRMVTPHMDRIAESGMLFNRCYVTNGICGPSRAVIQTGKYSHLNGFMTNGQSFEIEAGSAQGLRRGPDGQAGIRHRHGDGWPGRS